MKNFFTGFAYPFRVSGLFFKYPKIIIYSLIPFVVNLAVYISSFAFFYSQIIDTSSVLTGSANPDAGFFQETLHVLILALSFMILLVLCYFIIVIVGGIISAPFNENISLVIEESLTGRKSDYSPGFWTDSWLNIKSELKKLSFYLSFILFFFLLGFIPLIGPIISVVLGTLFSFFFNALDFLDYPMTRRYMTLRQKIKITFSRPMVSLGFGCAAFLIMFLPVLNIILKPLCVISGTVIYFEKEYGKEFDITNKI
ncbi:MAG: EI24 domain-containing protein [Ignavibacteria bacterium]|jgi:CysZ protein|nr:EI24 domain-containing protein [Ignavibacteria bacterium]